MTAHSGRKCAALLMKPNRAGCLVKMLLESSAWNSTACFLTWKTSATPRGRLLFQLAPSVPRTDETASGFWPTVTAAAEAPNMGSNKRNGPRSLVQVAVEMWPTPRAGKTTDENLESWQLRRNAGKVSTPPLTLAVKMYPTPMVGSTNPAAHNQISGQFRDAMKKAGVIGCLNPEWVEWLMGYPLGHTACADWETPSSRKSHTKYSKT